MFYQFLDLFFFLTLTIILMQDWILTSQVPQSTCFCIFFWNFCRLFHCFGDFITFGEIFSLFLWNILEPTCLWTFLAVGEPDWKVNLTKTASNQWQLLSMCGMCGGENPRVSQLISASPGAQCTDNREHIFCAECTSECHQPVCATAAAAWCQTCAFLRCCIRLFVHLRLH